MATPLEQQLFKALVLAQGHLDYCGYGDNWERECAEASGIEKKIDAAVEAGKEAGLKEDE
jgi:hypothetical protein